MAVMGTMRHSIIFGGVNSADFGIYISGEGVFDAPKRAVEMIAVPGRNGEIALDQGYWENIDIVYPAFNYEDDLDTFAERLSAFRNAICSLKGYQRLSDTFHPDEYRMAVYSEGLEVTPIKYNTAANFDLKFDCKPQRWLTEGETAVTVASGDTLTNPTQYDAGPLLIVEGYGDIRFNGYQIELKNEVYGEIVVVPAEQKVLAGQNVSKSFYLDPVLYRDGDPIETSIRIGWQVKSNESGLTFSSFDSVTYAGYQCYTTKLKHSNYLFATSTFYVSLVAGTSKSLATTATATYKYTLNSATVTETVTIELSVVYDATSDTLTFNVVGANSEKTYSMASEYVTTDMVANSTEDVLGEPTYINCEIGEAYKIEHDKPVSLNRYVDLGSDLPKFTKGDNQVTFNSTMITDLKIAPNWWKL